MKSKRTTPSGEVTATVNGSPSAATHGSMARLDGVVDLGEDRRVALAVDANDAVRAEVGDEEGRARPEGQTDGLVEPVGEHGGAAVGADAADHPTARRALGDEHREAADDDVARAVEIPSDGGEGAGIDVDAAHLAGLERGGEHLPGGADGDAHRERHGHDLLRRAGAEAAADPDDAVLTRLGHQDRAVGHDRDATGRAEAGGDLPDVAVGRDGDDAAGRHLRDDRVAGGRR